MTREELLARIEEHKAFVRTSQELINQEAIIDEGDDPWSGGFSEGGQMPTAPGTRHDRRHKAEAHRNETEVHVERVDDECRLAERAIEDGDGTDATFHEQEAARHRRLAEPMVAVIRKRANSKTTGAQGGKENERAVPNELIYRLYDQQMQSAPKLSFQEATRRVCQQLKVEGYGLSHSAIKERLRKR